MTNIKVYSIDNGVPVPEDDTAQIPLADLKVGESILFPLSRRNSVQAKASKLKRATGWDFRVKKQDNDSARIWRVK